MPVKKWINKNNLLKKIHFDDDLKNATPYVTSYYKKDWGFCMPKNDIKKLNKKKYFVNIDSVFKKGFLEVGEFFKKGKKKKEIFFSTYMCHPTMANDNLSSVALQIYLINYLEKKYKNSSVLEDVEYYLENVDNNLFLYLGEDTHKIKKKAEQSACLKGLKLLEGRQ